MIRTLLLTGSHNHDWRRSAPFCANLLIQSGRFTVDIEEDPSSTLELSGLSERYDLIFLDYNGPSWSDAANSNFVDAIRAGMGLVVLHGANNGFIDWIEFESMVGLLWRDNGGHGQFHEFTVDITDPQHPITQGLAPFQTWDELYHGLESRHGTTFHELASAYSEASLGGTAKREPMLITTQFGAGRVFQTMLGHVWPGADDGQHKGNSMIAFQREGFQRTLVRGAEWAATGVVTL